MIGVKVYLYDGCVLLHRPCLRSAYHHWANSNLSCTQTTIWIAERCAHIPSSMEPPVDTTHEKDTAATVDPPSSPDSEPKALDWADEKALDDKHVDNPRDARPIHGLKWVATLASLYSFALLYGLDTTIAADVQPAILKSLGNVQKLAWIGAGFPLGSVGTILPLGTAYGLFDLKKLIVASIIVFEAGSALCGGAPTMNALIAGRVIAGIGGGGMYLGALNFLAAFTTIRERSIYNAMIGMIWGLGTILGPIVGGLSSFASLLLTLTTWQVSSLRKQHGDGHSISTLFLQASLGQSSCTYLRQTNHSQRRRSLRSSGRWTGWEQHSSPASTQLSLSP